MTNEEKIKKRAIIAASGQVLCEHLPENYDDKYFGKDHYKNINEWVEAHAWQPFEYWPANDLWKHIDSIANTLIEFHEQEAGLRG